MDTDDINKKIEAKKEKIASLKKDEDYAVEKFDTLIVSLSSGGLVFSVGFIKDVIKDFHKTDLLWLKFCWMCFAVALIGSLTSQVTGYYSNRYERRAERCKIRKLKGETEIDSTDIVTVICKLEKMSDRFNRCTLWLNGICLLGFSIAVGSLIFFIYSNV